MPEHVGSDEVRLERGRSHRETGLHEGNGSLGRPVDEEERSPRAAPPFAPTAEAEAAVAPDRHPPSPPIAVVERPEDEGAASDVRDPARGGERLGAACTPAQMRRFIKSRPWVPMHELRRRFQIVGAEDDVVGVDVQGRRVYVGLPSREGQVLGELLRSGEIGYELSLDPATPIVIGVYPMRPVVRA